MPTMYVYEYGSVMMPKSFLMNTIMSAHLGLCLFITLYAQSLALLEYHFFYRYLAICKTLILCISFNHASTSHSQALVDHFREPLRQIYGFDVNKTAIAGPFIWDNFFLHLANSKDTTAMSEKSIKLQYELLRALLVQTLIPGIFEYIPGAIAWASVMPTMHAYGYGYALMPTSFLMNTIIPAHLGLCIYGALFSQDHFREPLWEIYGFDVNKTAIVGPLYKSTIGSDYCSGDF
ncbi:unnamed protein product, partial [Mesorhabditis belari]|uniref:Uncharacterized protein n=1 Tax=Mesorhabditis belari TaxID=2138241 RepID=A0AAF3EIX9_9BILA